MILFFGLALLVNSFYVAVQLFFQIIIFALTPFAEEIWLEDRYNDEYLQYKKRVPRFL